MIHGVVLSFVALFFVIVGQSCNESANQACGSVKDQKTCEFLWGSDQGPSCLWKLGQSPACISDFNQCDILGDYCHLDPACFINTDGKCVPDPCIENSYDGNACSNGYCIPHIMYDFDDVQNIFYNFTMCSSPTNAPNSCYYLGFYEHNSNNTYTFRNDVCEEYPTVCKHVVVNSPYLSGNYCTDGREAKNERNLSLNEEKDDEKDWSVVIALLIAILAVVVVGLIVVGIVLILAAVLMSRTGGAKKGEVESANNKWQTEHQPEPSGGAQNAQHSPNTVGDYESGTNLDEKTSGQDTSSPVSSSSNNPPHANPNLIQKENQSPIPSQSQGQSQSHQNQGTADSDSEEDSESGVPGGSAGSGSGAGAGAGGGSLPPPAAAVRVQGARSNPTVEADYPASVSLLPSKKGAGVYPRPKKGGKKKVVKTRRVVQVTDSS